MRNVPLPRGEVWELLANTDRLNQVVTGSDRPPSRSLGSPASSEKPASNR